MAASGSREHGTGRGRDSVRKPSPAATAEAAPLQLTCGGRASGA